MVSDVVCYWNLDSYVYERMLLVALDKDADQKTDCHRTNGTDNCTRLVSFIRIACTMCQQPYRLPLFLRMNLMLTSPNKSHS